MAFSAPEARSMTPAKTKTAIHNGGRQCANQEFGEIARTQTAGGGFSCRNSLGQTAPLRLRLRDCRTRKGSCISCIADWRRFFRIRGSLELRFRGGFPHRQIAIPQFLEAIVGAKIQHLAEAVREVKRGPLINIVSFCQSSGVRIRSSRIWDWIPGQPPRCARASSTRCLIAAFSLCQQIGERRLGTGAKHKDSNAGRRQRGSVRLALRT
jgi:hypothetical protein